MTAEEFRDAAIREMQALGMVPALLGDYNGIARNARGQTVHWAIDDASGSLISPREFAEFIYRCAEENEEQSDEPME
jgi:hypothetical protein